MLSLYELVRPRHLSSVRRALRRLLSSSLSEWIAGGLTLCAVLALCVNLGGFVADRARADRALDALRRVDAIAADLADAEAGQREFLLTGDEAYLAPYERTLATLPGDVAAAVAGVTGTDPARQQQLSTIERLARSKLGELQRAVALRREAKFDAALALIRSGEGHRVTEATRAIMHALEDDLQKAQAAEERRERSIAFVSAGAAAAGGMLATLLLALVAAERRRAVERQALSIEGLLREKAGAEFDRLSVGALLDALPVGVFIADANGRILRTNPRATTIWGGTAPHVPGIAEYGEYRAWWADGGKEIAAEDWALARALRTGEASISEVIDIARFDGSRGTILNSASTIRDAEGRILGAVAILQDITEPRRVEQALRESEGRLREREAQLRLFIENAPAGIAMFDREMRYLAVSRRFREDHQLGERDLAGRSHYEVFPDNPARWREIHQRCLATGTAERCEAGEPLPRADGTIQWRRWAIRPWRDAAGAVGGLMLFTEDITETKRAEATRSHLAAIVDSSDDAIVGKTLDGIVTSWNRAAEAMFGYRADEIVGRSVTLLMPPDRVGEEERILGCIRRGEKVAHFETVRRRKNGTEFTVALTISPILDADGRVIGASKIARDITEQKRAEAALRESEARLRRVIDEAPLPIMVHAEDGEVLQLSRAWTEASGYSREEIPTTAAWIARAYDAATANRARTGIREAHNSPGRYEGGEYTVRVADGSQRVWLFRGAPVGRDRTGRRLLVSMAMDLTETKRQEAALRQASERQAAILDALPAHVALLDADGTIVAVSDAWRRFGAANGLPQADGGVGMNYLALCDKAASEAATRGAAAESTEGAAIIGAALHALLAGERERFAIDYPCHAPGELRWFRCMAAPVALGDSESSRSGRRRGAVVMHIDITEARRAEDALRQAQKLDAVGQLTSGIAHDFNNYLTVIAGNLDLLERAGAGSAKAARLIAEGQAAAARAERLVRQLLAFSRRQALTPESLDCNTVVREIEDLLRRTLPAGTELAATPAAGLWRAWADRNQLETALLNLIVNARDAIAESGGGGRITIRTANVTLDGAGSRRRSEDVAPGDYVEVAVIDTGRGMPADVLTRVFEPFFTTKGPGKGTGLGLAQIYGFAKQSKGHVEIDSHESKGTTVRLLLPRDTAGVVAAAAAAALSPR